MARVISAIVGGVNLAYDEAGDGPAVVLLHSSAGDRRMWDGQVPVLVEAGYRVVRCDRPGFGDSPALAGPYDEAGEVVGLLDQLRIDRAAFVGASTGARVALEIAARWPGRVTALALLCPTPGPGASPSAALAAFERRQRELLEAGDIDGATELNVRTWLGPDASATARESLGQMQRHILDTRRAAVRAEPIQVDHDLSKFTLPTLVVAGGRDLVDFRRAAAEVAERVAGQHLELEWAGHLPSLEHPYEVNELLVDFLDAAAAAGGGARTGRPLRDGGRIAVFLAAPAIAAWLGRGRDRTRPKATARAVRAQARTRPETVSDAVTVTQTRLDAWLGMFCLALALAIIAGPLLRLDALHPGPQIATIASFVIANLAWPSLLIHVCRMALILLVGWRGFDKGYARVKRRRRGLPASRLVRWLCTPSQLDVLPPLAVALILTPEFIAGRLG